MNIIFLGPPGAGKGTIAFRVKEFLGIPHISTGDLFRAAIKNQSELGKKVKSILDAGDLVPDELTTSIVEERLKKEDCKTGFILDGFPRTMAQAQALKGIAAINVVINLAVTEKTIIKRLSGRRVCRSCGQIFHIDSLPPAREGLCDQCGGELYTRDDDQITAIKNRLAVYEESTKPLIDYYRKEGNLKNLDGNQNTETVFGKLLEILQPS